MTAPDGRLPPSQRWATIRRAAEAALDLSAPERSAHLERVCGADAALRDEVERLVAACERARRSGSFLAVPAAELFAPRSAALCTLRRALAGQYEIEREIGRGGMATVYVAYDRRHARQVAVKALDVALGAAVSAELFLSEIRVTARLTHPHILPLHASGEASGQLYYVMPYVEGESLRRRLRRERPLPVEVVVRLVREVASALDYAHRHDIVHRDIKPENILLVDGHAVVADFGIARAVSRAAGELREAGGHAGDTGVAPDAGRGRPAALLGTPAYMAPEQVLAEPTAGRSADLYALGLVAYEALNGAHPFGARPPREMLAAQVAQQPRPLGERRPDLPPGLTSLIMRLLAKAPEARPRSAGELVRELDAVFASPEDVAGLLAAAVRTRLAVGGGQGGAPIEGRTPEPGAHALYLKGRHVFGTRTNREGLLQAATYFEQALALDPGYARAHAGLSDVHARLAVFGYGLPGAELARARAAALEALARDATLAEAHTSLGHVLLVHDFDMAAAERELRRAIALDPGYTFARVPLAICLQDQGRFEEAVAELETARTLDPLAAVASQVLGRVYVNARQPDRAIRALGDALELNPQLDLSYQQLGHAYLQKGMATEAIDAFRRAAELSGARDSAHLGYAHAVLGERRVATRILRTLLASAATRYIPPFHVAMAYAGLGDVDAAFRWLERGYAERASFMDGVAVTPAFDALHEDPRWRRLIGRMRPGG